MHYRVSNSRRSKCTLQLQDNNPREENFSISSFKTFFSRMYRLKMTFDILQFARTISSDMLQAKDFEQVGAPTRAIPKIQAYRRRRRYKSWSSKSATPTDPLQYVTTSTVSCQPRVMVSPWNFPDTFHIYLQETGIYKGVLQSGSSI